jgi:hypothetical protein
MLPMILFIVSAKNLFNALDLRSFMVACRFYLAYNDKVQAIVEMPERKIPQAT